MEKALPAKASAAETSAETRGHWLEDKLDRDGESTQLKAFLKFQWDRNQKTKKPATEIREALVVNLNGPWGTGKTFFLDRFTHELEPSCVIRINAWENDFGEDPLVAISQPILKEINITNKKSAGEFASAARTALGRLLGAGVKGAVRQIGKKAFGEQGSEEIQEALSDILSEITNKAGDLSADAVETLLDEHEAKKDALVEFRESISALIRSEDQPHTPPIYVLVDELDRCRPTYAISFLEKIKHIFQIPEFVFLIATDTGQLEKSVKAVYGAEFDSKTYLRRFFRFTFHLSEIIPTKVAQSFIKENEWQTDPSQNFPLAEILANLSYHFECSTRDFLQALELTNTARSQLDSSTVHLPMLFSEAIAFLKFGESIDWLIATDRNVSNYKPRKMKVSLNFVDRVTQRELSSEISTAQMLDTMRNFSRETRQNLENMRPPERIELLLRDLELRTHQSSMGARTKDYSSIIRRCGQFQLGTG